jgi:galactokinase
MKAMTRGICRSGKARSKHTSAFSLHAESGVGTRRLPEELAERFIQELGRVPILVRAPGRVNLIGEHTDYNDGFVLPAALRYQTWVAAASRNDRTVTVRSHGFEGTRSFDLDALPSGVRNDWSDHVRGMLVELQRDGARLCGADLAIDADLPLGAGLSSSASVLVSSGLAMIELAGLPLDRVALAKTAQRAEHEHVGIKSGIMDQFVVANARAGTALLLDTRSLQPAYLPLPEQAAIVVCNTLVTHELASSEYNQRRAECERGVELLDGRYGGIRALRDVTLAQLEAARAELPETIYRRCRHVVTENARTQTAAHALQVNDFVTFGKLMTASHASLRDDFEVSCSELDALADAAHRFGKGCYGSRMTGGGFGGSTVSLVDAAQVEPFVTLVTQAYREATGITPHVCVGAGAAGAEVERR